MVVETAHAIIDEVKKRLKISHKCPICNQNVQFGIENGYLKTVTQFPFTHIVLHGNPVHALIVYIDAKMAVRQIETSTSIEIARDGPTFNQLLKKWSNPF